MSFDIWYEKNEDKLIERYIDENPELMIHHDDMPDIGSSGHFQNWVDKVYKLTKIKKSVSIRRKDGVIQRYKVKPDYPYCNKGHLLVEVFDNKRNSFVWDCPTCIRNIEKERQGVDADYLYGVYKDK